MIVLVGLGNPGKQYERQRHNVGFMAVDAIGEACNFGDPRKKFNASLREGTIEGPTGRQKAILLKPQTYMNDSGKSVGELVRFYKLAPENIIVFHDELDLAPGKLRIKTGGGNAGHNGLRSIDAHIGNGFHRVRIGIGHPGKKSAVHNYVLGDFAKTDQDWLQDMLDAVAKAAPHLADESEKGFARFQSEVAAWMNPNPHTSKQGEKKTNLNTGQKSALAQNQAAPQKQTQSLNEATQSANPFKEALGKLLPEKKK